MKCVNDQKLIASLNECTSILDLELNEEDIELTASDGYALWYLGVLVAEFCFVGWLSAYLLQWFGYLSFPFILLLWGAIGNQLIILLHECAHRTLVTSRSMNRKIGNVIGALVGLNFDIFTKAHMRHHLENGDSKDTELSQLNESQGVIEVFRYVFGLPSMSIVIGLHERGNLPDSAIPIHLLATLGLHFLIIIGFYFYLGDLLGSLLFTLSIPSTAMILRRFRVVTEHLAPGKAITRSHEKRLLDQFFFNGFGMNWHIEHHLYPTIPGYRLQGVHEQLKNKGLLESQLVSRSVGKTLGTLYKTLSRVTTPPKTSP